MNFLIFLPIHIFFLFNFFCYFSPLSCLPSFFSFHFLSSKSFHLLCVFSSSFSLPFTRSVFLVFFLFYRLFLQVLSLPYPHLSLSLPILTSLLICSLPFLHLFLSFTSSITFFPFPLYFFFLVCFHLPRLLFILFSFPSLLPFCHLSPSPSS